ncbi:MAG: PIG-L family deacetylase [Anaerolineae bacterium]|nr:PIG-L family deacetylase [Anaerolineae bacterium]
MVIVAHPDDIEFSCAGTIARWVRDGAEVCYVLVTSGDVGIATPGMTKAEAARIREAEQTAAAAVVGVHNVVYLRHPDGMVEATMELRRQLVREIRRFRPDTVITGDPTALFVGEGYINHPDHRAVALAAIDAIFPAAGQPNLFEELEAEGLKAHKPYKVYVQSWGEATTWVNISDTIDLKIEALRQHKSQMGDWDPADMVRQWAGDAAKGKEMAYAEQYRVITFEDAAPKEDAEPMLGEGATAHPEVPAEHIEAQPERATGD